MSFLKSYFSAPSPPADGTPAVRALPASWYTSPEMYELERRAIFSKKWMLTTHKLRLGEEGDWIRYAVAGFDFVICKDRTGSINAFHNVCRHRAFPIVTKDNGHNSVFACKYHGWSYGLNGKLAKAPGYQDLEGFDKTQNSLLRIHVHVDSNGFIWVNLDGGEKPEVKWEDDFAGVDTQERFQNVNFDDYVFDHSWETTGEYNWKILADNYNEGYHCRPDDAASKEQTDKGIRGASTYYFPNASMNIASNVVFLQRFIPLGPTSSTMKYEAYRHKDSSDTDLQATSETYKRLMAEDQYLCTHAQKNLNAGVFVSGEMHPQMEQGPLLFQQTVRELMQAHHDKEVEANAEIWPARQQLPKSKNSEISQKDVGFCSNVDCCKLSGGGDGGATKGISKEALVF